MKTKILNLPFTDIQVLVNGTPVTFNYYSSSHNKWEIDNIAEVTALGAITISIDPQFYKQGDLVFIKSSAGKMESDGGGEYTVNQIAELDDYTYGMSAPDTQFVEWNFGNIPGDVPSPERFGYIKHSLSYELIEVSEYGMGFKILKGTENESYHQGKLLISVVWESNTKEYAYELVSLLTY